MAYYSPNEAKLGTILRERRAQKGKSEVREIRDFDANAIVTIILKSLAEYSPDFSMPLEQVVPTRRPYMNAIDTYTVLPGTRIKHGYDISTDTKTGKVRSISMYDHGMPCGLYAFADDSGKIKKIGSLSAPKKGTDTHPFGTELSWWDESYNPAIETVHDDRGNPIRTRKYCQCFCCYAEEEGIYLGPSLFIRGHVRRHPLSKTPYCIGRTMLETGYDTNDLQRANTEFFAPTVERTSPGIDLEPFLQLLPHFKPINLVTLNLEKE